MEQEVDSRISGGRLNPEFRGISIKDLRKEINRKRDVLKQHLDLRQYIEKETYQLVVGKFPTEHFDEVIENVKLLLEEKIAIYREKNIELEFTLEIIGVKK